MRVAIDNSHSVWNVNGDIKIPALKEEWISDCLSLYEF